MHITNVMYRIHLFLLLLFKLFVKYYIAKNVNKIPNRFFHIFFNHLTDKYPDQAARKLGLTNNIMQLARVYN